MFKFSKKSLLKINSCKSFVAFILNRALERTPIDFGVSAGLRTADEQNALFLDPNVKTNCDGYVKKSKHQSGVAVDIYAYLNGKASFDLVHLAILFGVIRSCAMEYGYTVIWGGTFGSDDFHGWDAGHFEFYKMDSSAII